jgi:hypothetical protein
MNPRRCQNPARPTQTLLMFLVAFGISILAAQFEHFGLSRLTCLFIALVLAVLIALPSFHLTRRVAEFLFRKCDERPTQR